MQVCVCKRYLTNELSSPCVALRIRPLTEKDRAQPRFANASEGDVLKAHDKTVHVVPHNKLFTFDHVFGTNSTQGQVFAALGHKSILKFIEGYNVTILAYVILHACLLFYFMPA